MKTPVIEALIHAVLTAAVCSLKCKLYHQANFKESFSKGFTDVKTCQLEYDVCLMVFYVLQQRSETKQSGFQFVRQCGKSSECNLTGSLTTGGYKIRYSTTCCSIDQCLPALPVLQEENSNKNGVICPSCHSTKETLCFPKRAMECTGDETRCILVNEILFREHHLHSYGCGTKSVIENRRIVRLLSYFSTMEVSNAEPMQGLKIGNFLWCHVCHEENAATCSKKRTLCEPDEDICISERRRIIDEQGRRLTMQIRRSCGKSAECQFNGIITSQEKTLSIKTSCCGTDLCTAPEPTWPNKKRKHNGKICPACFPPNNSLCSAEDVVQCNGDDSHCIHYSTTLTEGNTVLLSEVYTGCSTAEVCEQQTNKRLEMPQYQAKIMTEIICNRGIRIMNQLFSLIITKYAAWSLMGVCY